MIFLYLYEAHDFSPCLHIKPQGWTHLKCMNIHQPPCSVVIQVQLQWPGAQHSHLCSAKWPPKAVDTEVVHTSPVKKESNRPKLWNVLLVSRFFFNILSFFNSVSTKSLYFRPPTSPQSSNCLPADELLLLQDYFLLAVHLGNEVCRTIFNKSQSSKEWE